MSVGLRPNEARETLEEGEKIQGLFAAVVHQALVDAHATRHSFNRKRPVRRPGESNAEYKERVRDTFRRRRKAAMRERDEARAWLTTNSDDFRMVCSLAGYDPDYLRDGILKLEEKGWPEVRRREFP